MRIPARAARRVPAAQNDYTVGCSVGSRAVERLAAICQAASEPSSTRRATREWACEKSCACSCARPAQLTFSVVQDGNIVHFKIKRKTQLKKLMEAYCNRQSLQMDQIRFLFDGNRLRETQSPDELEMEDDDVIDAMLFQVGGK